MAGGAAFLGYEPSAVDVVAVASIAVWLLVIGAVRWARRPVEPRAGPKALELGPEPPAVANLLVHDFALTHEAVPATLLDLAARDVVDLEHRGPGEFVCRLKRRAVEPKTRYELRVLELLRRRAHDGVVPPEALTTGPADESRKWWSGFRKEVIDDCQERGLSRDLWDANTLSALTIVGLVPAPLMAIAFEWRVGFAYGAGVFLFVGFLRAGRRQRDTPVGLEAASRWLGVRAWLREDKALKAAPAITVALWERHLAYAAAFGFAGEASRLLGLGAESDTQAWSAHGGRWRRVRVRYPGGLLPLGWGLSPIGATLRGLLFTAAGGIATAVLAPVVDGWANVILVPPLGAAAVGVALLALGISDIRSSVEITGPILRLRKRGTDKSPRYYLAVDHGSPTVRAWVVRPEIYARLRQDEMVTASVTPRLRHVRSVRPAR